jgi:hypothetical protein
VANVCGEVETDFDELDSDYELSSDASEDESESESEVTGDQSDSDEDYRPEGSHEVDEEAVDSADEACISDYHE